MLDKLKVGLQGENILFISPHYDDVIFSLGGVLPWFIKQFNCSLVNIFSESNFIFERTGDREEATKKRKEEDQLALNLIGIHEIYYGGFSEALLRGIGRKNLFVSETFAVQSILNEIVPGIHSLVNSIGKDKVLFAPCGFGGHIDHLAVKLACAGLPNPIYYYTDLPYATDDKSYNNSHASEFTRHLSVLKIPSNRQLIENHIQLSKSYKTQFLPKFENEMFNHLTKNGYLIWLRENTHWSPTEDRILKSIS